MNRREHDVRYGSVAAQRGIATNERTRPPSARAQELTKTHSTHCYTDASSFPHKKIANYLHEQHTSDEGKKTAIKQNSWRDKLLSTGIGTIVAILGLIFGTLKGIPEILNESGVMSKVASDGFDRKDLFSRVIMAANRRRRTCKKLLISRDDRCLD